MKFTFAPESRPLDGYTIKRAIHRGGFGEVYYALSDAGKEVALKLLHNNLEVELRGVSQCLNLKHPNLVTIFDMRQDSEKDYWIVMEFVGGKGLYEVLQEHPAGMPLKDVLAWMAGITAGLSYLHDRGIVHRDLKPANVFSESGIVKIGDVGLSKYISESRRSAQTQSVGTVYYMAPEVARGRYGREVDVYSMGVILYEMITGRVPFEGETTAEILMKHMTAEPDLSVLPERLRPVIAAALEKDPDLRISDIEELDRRFRLAVQESGFAIDMPAPVLESKPRNGRRSTPAMATTLLGNEPATAGSSVVAMWRSLSKFWTDNVPTPIKWIATGALLIMILRSGILVGPMAFGGTVGGLAYLVYRKFFRPAESGGAVAAVTVGPAVAERPTPAPPEPVLHQAGQAAPVMVGAHQRYVPAQPMPRPAPIRIYSPATVRQIPAGQRATDVTASLSLSLAAVALVTTAVHFATNLLPGMADVAFFGSVTLIAAWALVIPAKMWEGRSGDAVVRRLIQGGIGVGVGALAFVIQQFLLLNENPLLITSSNGGAFDGHIGRISLLDGRNEPTMAGFMVFFGLLFLIRRWWWHADSFRKSRFRISSALVTLLLGVILTSMLPFPETLGATWALAISAVVQLSSGWTPQEDRLLNPAPGFSQAAPFQVQVRHPVLVTPARAGQKA